MRLRFWSDALNKIYDKEKNKTIPDHPVIYEVNNVSCMIQITNYLDFAFIWILHSIVYK